MDVSRTLEKSIEDTLFYGKETAIEEIMKIVFETIMKLERSEFLKTVKLKTKQMTFILVLPGVLQIFLGFGFLVIGWGYSLQFLWRV